MSDSDDGGHATKSRRRQNTGRRPTPATQQQAKHAMSSYESSISLDSADMDGSFTEIEMDENATWLHRKYPRCGFISKLVVKFLDSWPMLLVVSTITIWALIGDDVRIASFPPSSDDTCSTLYAIIFFYFAVEFFLNLFCRPEFLFSFFFFLDLLSALSLIPDIPFLWNPILVTFGINPGDSTQSLVLLRAGRLSQVGTRAGRIVRLVRLVRLARFMNLYNSIKQALGYREISSRRAKLEAARAAREAAILEAEMRAADEDWRGDGSEAAVGGVAALKATISKSKAQHLGSKNSKYTQLKATSLIHKDEQSTAAAVREQIHARQTQVGVRSTTSSAMSGYASSRFGSRMSGYASKMAASGYESADSALAEEKELEEENDSNVGRKLSDLTTLRVVIGVLIMMFVVPALTYTDTDYSADALFYQIHAYSWPTYAAVTNASIPNIGFPALNAIIVQGLAQQIGHVLYLKTNTTERVNFPAALAKLRAAEYTHYENTTNGITTSMTVSFKELAVSNSQLNIGLTCFLMALLAFGAALFASDAQELVIAPIERMVSFVRTLAKGGVTKETSADDKSNETQLLEGALVKLGGLLQVGFGTGGSEVIAKYIRGVRVDPMQPGRIVDGSFVAFTLRDFDRLVACLGPKSTVVLNQVIELLHSHAHEQGGCANKNDGLGLMCVWRFLTSAPRFDPNRQRARRMRMQLLPSQTNASHTVPTRLPSVPSEIAPDQVRPQVPAAAQANLPRASVISASNVSLGVTEADVDVGGASSASSTSSDVFDFDVRETEMMNSNARLEAQRVLEASLVSALRVILDVAVVGLTNRWRVPIPATLPPVRVTLGLHTGWAVEGAVGSEHKIDALYLSKHVDLTSLLDVFASEYNVPLVFSSEVFDLLSPELQRHCRWLDAVQVRVLGMQESTLDSFAPAEGEEAFELPSSLAPVGGAQAAQSALKDPLDQQQPLVPKQPKAPIEPRFIFLDLYTFDITSDGLALARLSDMTAIAAEPPTAASDSQTIDLRKGFGASVTRRLSTVLGLGGASVDSPSTTSTDTLSPASSQATNGSANKREIEMAETRIKKSDSSRMKQRRQTGSTALLAETAHLSPSVIVPRRSVGPSSSTVAGHPFYISALCSDDLQELASLQSGLNPDFVPCFNNATRHYVLGQWDKARQLYEQCLEWVGQDAATLKVLEFMEEHQFVAPPTWNGYRQIAPVDL